MYDERPKPTQADWEAVRDQYAQEAAEPDRMRPICSSGTPSSR